MKTILSLIACLLLSFAALAQEPAVTTGADNKSELVYIFSVPGTQDALFTKTKQWIFHSYQSGKTVEQLEDKTTGHFLIRALTPDIIRPENGMNDGSFAYDLTIDVREGKARFTVTNIYYEAGVTSKSLLVASGANLNDSYPANWPTVRKKTFENRWRIIQDRAKQDLASLAKQYQAFLLKKSDGF